MVKDSQDMPIDGAEVTLLFYMAAMPAMKMPEMRSEVKLRGAGNGRYTGKGQVMMAGPWTVTVSVRQNGREIGQQTMTITAK
jgi:Cu(I)/Ag(I) efflux system membrane fusion protein/cobalt-zinc-cadmium efflux system membrane fusion protein